MNYQIFAVIASAMKLPDAACRSFYRAVLRTGAQGRVYWFPARAGSTQRTERYRSAGLARRRAAQDRRSSRVTIARAAALALEKA